MPVDFQQREQDVRALAAVALAVVEQLFQQLQREFIKCLPVRGFQYLIQTDPADAGRRTGAAMFAAGQTLQPFFQIGIQKIRRFQFHLRYHRHPQIHIQAVQNRGF